MSILTREDGTQFVLRSYRELIAQKNTALIKNELRLLAQSNGQFARVHKHSSGSYEAAFSPEPGYLFGETVWAHFSRQKNVLYCEKLAESDYVLVVVKDGIIHIDAQFSLQELSDELRTLSAEAIRYQIYCYGDVPLNIIEEAGKVYFSEAHVNTFTVLEAPLLNQLTLQSEFQLVDIEYAIGQAKLNQGSGWFVAAAILLVIGLTWWLWPQATPEQQRVDTHQQALQALRRQLTTPPPSDQIKQIVATVTQMISIPGWETTQVVFTNNVSLLQMHSLGGTVRGLMAWAKQHEAGVRLDRDGAQLVVPYITQPGPRKVLANSQLTLAQIIDSMMKIIPQRSVTIGQTTAQDLYKSTEFSLKIDHVSPDVVLLVAKALAGLPITMQNAHIAIKNGMYSGSFNFIVLGTKV